MGFFLIFQPRGCGIVEFGSEAEAKLAVEKMHNYFYKGRNLTVYIDRKGLDHPRKQKNATPERDELRRSLPSDYKYVDFYFISFRDHSHIIRQMFFGHFFYLRNYPNLILYSGNALARDLWDITFRTR